MLGYQGCPLVSRSPFLARKGDQGGWSKTYLGLPRNADGCHTLKDVA